MSSVHHADCFGIQTDDAVVSLDAKQAPNAPLNVMGQDWDFDKFSGSRLSVGSRLSRRDMLHIALMSSENRAAAALSRDYVGGRPGFVAAMNARARALGMRQKRVFSRREKSKKKPAQGGLNYLEFRDPVARRIMLSVCGSLMKVLNARFTGRRTRFPCRPACGCRSGTH